MKNFKVEIIFCLINKHVSCHTTEDNTVLAEKEADIEENRYLETTSTCTSSHKVALHYK